jgi:hypothetical protein
VIAFCTQKKKKINFQLVSDHHLLYRYSRYSEVLGRGEAGRAITRVQVYVFWTGSFDYEKKERKNPKIAVGPCWVAYWAAWLGVEPLVVVSRRRRPERNCSSGVREFEDSPVIRPCRLHLYPAGVARAWATADSKVHGAGFIG